MYRMKNIPCWQLATSAISVDLVNTPESSLLQRTFYATSKRKRSIFTGLTKFRRTKTHTSYPVRYLVRALYHCIWSLCLSSAIIFITTNGVVLHGPIGTKHLKSHYEKHGRKLYLVSHCITSKEHRGIHQLIMFHSVVFIYIYIIQKFPCEGTRHSFLSVR